MAERLKLVDSLKALERELGGVSPYPGLRPFSPEESRFFRGRETQVLEIGQRLARESCVSVLGGSGCGKSSIVRAGVIPALRRKLIPGRGDLWRAAIFTPGRVPIDNLIKALAETLSSAADEESASQRTKKIREVLYGANGLGGFLPEFRNELDLDPRVSVQVRERANLLGVNTGVSVQAREHANLLLVVDQFEELFRDEHRGQAQAADLVGLVVDFWRRRKEFAGLYVALTLRSDDLHRCVEVIDLPELINATAYLTRRLNEDELREAIVAPVRPPMFRAGLLEGALAPGELDLRPYDVQVVTELLDAAAEIAHDPDHLPLLQHLLAVLWRSALERWQREADNARPVVRPQITRDDLAEALGFEKWSDFVKERNQAYRKHARGWLLRYCLERVADELLKGGNFGTPLTQAQEEITRTAFCLMGEVDDRGSFKRRWTDKEEIARVAGLGDSNHDIDAFIHRFSQDHHLLLVRESGVMDVSHEALMRNWPRLAAWLIEDRDAGRAYLSLGQHYDKWKQANQNRLSWLWSWFSRKSCLLGSDTLEHIAPLLTHEPGQFWRFKPRYNSYWAQRFLLPTSSGDINQGAEKTGKPQTSLLETEFKGRLRYLKFSTRLYVIKSALPIIILLGSVSFLALIVWQQSRVAEAQRQAAETQREFTANVLWDGLEGWRPVLKQEYVDSLWNLARAEPELRTEFVRQIPKGDHIKQMGFRPQPIIRAIGLRWPRRARELLSGVIEKHLTETGHDIFWTESSLACATAAFADHLDSRFQAKATAHFEAYIQKELRDTSNDIWTRGRILACLGARLNSETIESALLSIFQNAQAKARESDGRELSAIISAVTAAAWWIRATHGELSSERLEVMENVVEATIAHLKNDPTDWWATYQSRSLVSLIAALPLEHQQQALEEIFSAVPEWPEFGGPNIFGILAQAFEIAATKHAEHGKADDLKSLLQLSEKLLSQSNADPSQWNINEIVIARLVVPLAQAAPAHVTDRLSAALRRVADIEDAAIEETNCFLESADYFAQYKKSLLIGLRGRVLAYYSAENGFSALATPGKLLNCTINAIRVGGSGGENKSNLSENFAREGLAQAIGALSFSDDERVEALNSAKMALASTGSAEEAAAWARAITNLLQVEDDIGFVEEIIEILKYPTSGLTAREPNAEEPLNATDILIQALVERLNLPKPVSHSPGYHRRVVEEIVMARQFSHIKLETIPNDPREPPGADSK